MISSKYPSVPILSKLPSQIEAYNLYSGDSRHNAYTANDGMPPEPHRQTRIFFLSLFNHPNYLSSPDLFCWH
ncbi:hypothetical protein VN97_g8916 [Penicillium thymicola]|uniref:Uncharacterized protein n=1 Tax=Penicillium thymicola TaxID=293382 RepID=A0AAI9X5I8_PENTH|nr:hypothetical protein VN97_g8916 [Penicillium thymicola]